MISGTQRTALATCLRVGDWEGVIQLVDNMVSATVKEALAVLRQEAELAKPAVAPVVGRALDVEFVVSYTRAALVVYTVRVPTKLLALGSDVATVVLLVNGVCAAQARNLASLGVGLSINDERDHDKVLSAVVPAGATVLLATLEVSANAAAPSLVAQQEVLL